MGRILSVMDRVFEMALEEERERLDVSMHWTRTIKRLTAEEDGSADSGDKVFTRLTHREVREREQLAEVKAALKRLDEGMYGRCELCESPIELASLLEVPWARYCGDCLANLPEDDATATANTLATPT